MPGMPSFPRDSGSRGTSIGLGPRASSAPVVPRERSAWAVSFEARLPVTSEIISPCEELAQVEPLLADSLFSQSKRERSFLRYVTERAFKNAREPLTERLLGIEIFGRRPNYDTDADPIVRVTASEWPNAPRKWDSRNVQIALECSVANRESGVPRFLAAHYW